MSKVNKTDTCWLWTDCVSDFGHGRINVNRRDTKAHRVSYELFVGPIPDGMHVLHTCDVPACVNPKHLYPGTDRDNIDDKVSRNRQTKGMDCSLAKFTFEQITEMRRLREEERTPKKQIEEQFGISRRHLNDILNYKWRVNA